MYVSPDKHLSSRIIITDINREIYIYIYQYYDYNAKNARIIRERGKKRSKQA